MGARTCRLGMGHDVMLTPAWAGFPSGGPSRGGALEPVSPHPRAESETNKRGGANRDGSRRARQRLHLGLAAELGHFHLHQPAFLGSVAVGLVGTGKGVALDGGRAYVAANTQGLQIYDLSGAAAPVLLDALGTVGDALGIVVDSGLAYVADFPATITIIHVSAP